MLKVKVRRSAILIYPYTMGMLDNLEKALSVWDNIIHKYTTHLYDFVEEENSKYGVLKIPKGFGVDMICDMLTMKGVAYELIDESDWWPEVRKVEIPVTKTPRNQIQENSTDFLNETFTKSCGQAFLQLDTGVGKTFTCVNHENKKGFTIPELLAVIVILGILITISIGVYNGISKRLKENNLNTKIAYFKEKALEYASEENISDETISLNYLLKLGYVSAEYPENPERERIGNPLTGGFLDCMNFTITKDCYIINIVILY